jgi:uncharacterized membrane protein
MEAITVVTALGCGLNAGVFFAFSTFVMQGLRRAPTRSGLEAMQGINVAAPSPLFMLVLFGTALLTIVTAVWALVEGGDGAAWCVAGALFFLVFTIGLTITFHVPRNDALATVRPGAPTADAEWRAYLGPWTAANHLRTVGALGAATAFTLALVA